ncbi:MAG: alkaline phosphatase family protein, partial [Nitrososphaerales archaeon]
LEIDGLSYYHMKEAIESGRMPRVKELMEEQGYELSRVDCGLPSQTSACQAGILFGDNYDIPAFRWYDKGQGRAYVSGKDAGVINARYAKGNGLLRGGSSINNMMNGDAAKSLLTLADLRGGTPEEKKRRAQDIYLLMINPYFIMRTVVLLIGEALLEVWQYYRDKRNNVQPILNRVKHGYPLIRAACSVFMRDVAEYLVTLDIVRGAPAIYATWPGYDEVAHHTGPSTQAAFDVLSKYDKTIGRIADVIRRKGPRPYDLIVLSDHGQSFGATYKQRYGFSLMEFIERHLPVGSGVQQSTGGDDGTIALTAVGGELENLAGQDVGGKVAQSVARSGQKALEAGVARDQKGNATPADAAKPTAVTVFGSGNLAPVYFHFSNNRVTRSELDATYPGLFSGLLAHEGVGAIVAYEADGTPMVWGKTGNRNLRTGAIEGEEPLRMYGDPGVRAEQLSRLADFPNNGDLTIFSTVYPDGTVAAMEELIGSHGGMGGVQTDAFLFHPKAVTVPPTTNSADVFKILDARRREAVVPGAELWQEKSAADDFAPASVAAGIKRVREWLPLAVRAVLLNPRAYADIVRRPLMTGPALLIGVLTPIIAGVVRRDGLDLQLTLQGLVRWLVATGVIFLAGQVLTARAVRSQGKHRASYAEVFRGLGFAQGAMILELLALVPVLSTFARTLSTLLVFIASWLAAAVAFDLRGWRAILFPLVMIVVFVLSVAVIVVLLQGAALTLTTVAQELGLAG